MAWPAKGQTVASTAVSLPGKKLGVPKKATGMRPEAARTALMSGIKGC